MKGKKKCAKSNSASKAHGPGGKAVPFVLKAHDMISTCDNSIASWCDEGTTIIIKDVRRFEMEVIPLYYKHNKFTSFLRQLHICGFRKIMSDSLRIVNMQDASDEPIKYKHDHFQEGKSELLPLVRKRSGEIFDIPAKPDEVKADEVAVLKQSVADLTHEVTNLNALVRVLMGNGQVSEPPTKENFAVPQGEKRKTDHSHIPNEVSSGHVPKMIKVEPSAVPCLLEPGPVLETNKETSFNPVAHVHNVATQHQLLGPPKPPLSSTCSDKPDSNVGGFDSVPPYTVPMVPSPLEKLDVGDIDSCGLSVESDFPFDDDFLDLLSSSDSYDIAHVVDWDADYISPPGNDLHN